MSTNATSLGVRWSPTGDVIRVDPREVLLAAPDVASDPPHEQGKHLLHRAALRPKHDANPCKAGPHPKLSSCQKHALN